MLGITRSKTKKFTSWISFDLNEPQLEVSVYYQAKAKYFEIISPTVCLEELKNIPYRISSDLFEQKKDLFLEVVADTLICSEGNPR